jgi:gamma-glutamyltranspeptidase/glutathione hydrolase
MSKAKGVIAAGHEITVAAAAEILSDGGNAFDAAIAGLFASCVPEVVFSSIGGGGFLMAQKAGGSDAVLYDFFAQTPASKRPKNELEFYGIQADFGPATQEFHIGAGAAAVPGFVQGAFRVHSDLCRLPMSRIVEPAVRAARDGVVVSDFHAYLFTIVAPILTASDSARACFAPGDGLLAGGDVYRNSAFAETLDGLGREGRRLFTEGELARAMVAQSQDNGGHLTMNDFAAYDVELRRPLLWRHRDAELLLNPAPAASGPLIAFGLGLLQRFLPEGAPGALDLAAIMSETNAVRSAQASDLSAVTGHDVIDRHLNALAGHPQMPRGTTHISVIDADGNAAAASVSNGEGNGSMVGEFGYMLNNMLGEEDLNAGGFHAWRPDTRLSSMMAPTLIRERSGALTALGSGGSNRIRTAVLQVAVNLIDRGQELEPAVTAPRIHVEKGGKLSFEAGPWSELYSDEERDALVESFEDVEVWPERNVFFGGVHAARALGGGYEGAGDPRRAGAATVVR